MWSMDRIGAMQSCGQTQCPHGAGRQDGRVGTPGWRAGVVSCEGMLPVAGSCVRRRVTMGWYHRVRSHLDRLRSGSDAPDKEQMMSLDRRQFLAATSAAFASSALGWRGAFARTPGQAPPKTAFTPLRRSVGIFTGQGGTIGWHVDKTGAVVVDSQFPATAAICLEGIRARAGGRMIDYLLNTHHHGDHTAGNAVFQPAVRKILAHVNVPKLQKMAAEQAAAGASANQAPQPPQVCANATYENVWREEVGNETMELRYYGPAHTSGDSVITFEKANVVHMGDLVFNRRHPFIDKPAGASIENWMKVLDKAAAAHGNDTIYIFGHAGPGFAETGKKADLAYMRDYLEALVSFVRSELKAGKPREAILQTTDPLKGFPDHGPLSERVLAAAHEEVSASR